jgi:hypothetical protein
MRLTVVFVILVFFFWRVEDFSRTKSSDKALYKIIASYCYVPSWPILTTLMMEAIRSSETWLLTRATRRNISEDEILHSHRRANLKSYTATGTFKMMSAYGEECLSRAHVLEWHRRFKEGRESLQDDERKGRPSASRTEESTEVIQKCLIQGRTWSVRVLKK